MIFDFSEKSGLLLVFFVHGIVFATLLLVQGIKHERKSSLWLAGFTLLGCLYIAPFMLGYAGWYGLDGYREFLFYAPLQQLFLIGPVMYFYVQRLLNPDTSIRRISYLHFLPAAGYLLYALIIFVCDRFVFETVYFYADGRDKDFAAWYQVAGFVSMFFYFALTLHHYRRYKALAFQSVSYADSIVHRWMERYLTAFLVMLTLRLLFFALNPEWGQFGSKFWYYLCFAALLYYISLAGYVRAVQVLATTSLLPAPDFNFRQDQLPNDLHPVTADEADDALPDLAQWKEKLDAIMTADRLYENPGLTLQHVSAALGVTPRLVSSLVNQGFTMNFNDYVNRHRTRAVVGKLEAGEQRTKTLLALAFECGFNSKSTFNRAFKKEISVTPREFLLKNILK